MCTIAHTNCLNVQKCEKCVRYLKFSVAIAVNSPPTDT